MRKAMVAMALLLAVAIGAGVTVSAQGGSAPVAKVDEAARSAVSPGGAPPSGSAAVESSGSLASSSSLPSRDGRPGPDLLYRPLAQAPQFENAGVWRAQPILTSGASAYRNGEFLYQDFILDDFGADSNHADAQRVPLAGQVLVTSVGDYAYPTDPVYAANAADIVEIRVKVLPRATAFRIAYNTMLDPDVVATTLALGGSPGETHPVPHGANATMPASVFATAHGDQVELVDAATGDPIANRGAQATVDVRRRQAEVVIPFAVWDPRGLTSVRLAAASGVWNATAGTYRVPQASADATNPGGGGLAPNPPAFFNVAFRYTERGFWNEGEQASTLASGDLSKFFATVDFTKLAAGVTDEMANQPGGTPTTGFLSRIYASHFEPQQGKAPAPAPCVQPCEDLVPDLPGNLQPYMLYVPSKKGPAGYGLTFVTHGAAGNYRREATVDTPGVPNQGINLGERDTGSLVVWPGGRGGSLWWWGIASAEIFEIWADLATRYPLDPTFTAFTGASMGGYGTLRTVALWPDLFPRFAPIIPCTSAETSWAGPASGSPPSGEATVADNMAASFRNLPMFTQAAGQDVTCHSTAQRSFRDKMDALGYRYEWHDYPGEHISGGVAMRFLDQQDELSRFLGGARLGDDPAHVTYVMNLKANELKFGLNADRAYWVSDLGLRDESGAAPLGEIDVFSHGFGLGDPPALPIEQVTGLGYTGQKREWGDAPSIPVANQLDITAKNLDAVTIDVARAHVTCDATLNVQSDSPIVVRLRGCPGAPRTFAATTPSP